MFDSYQQIIAEMERQAAEDEAHYQSLYTESGEPWE